MEGKRVLVIDDEMLLRSLVAMQLRRHQFEVATAESGPNGLALTRHFKPDIIILDVMMPDMDGRATLKRLKADTTQAIPVILVTAKAHSSNQQDFDSLDVAAVLAKPFRPLKLAAEISRILDWS